jgi:hypothetical protein
MKQLDGLHWLQEFLVLRANDEWEHTYGVDIKSIDNPGWRVKIDFKQSGKTYQPFERTEIERSDSDWVHYWIDEETASFHGAGGSRNLVEIFDAFRAFIGE